MWKQLVIVGTVAQWARMISSAYLLNSENRNCKNSLQHPPSNCLLPSQLLHYYLANLCPVMRFMCFATYIWRGCNSFAIVIFSLFLSWQQTFTWFFLTAWSPSLSWLERHFNKFSRLVTVFILVTSQHSSQTTVIRNTCDKMISRLCLYKICFCPEVAAPDLNDKQACYWHWLQLTLMRSLNIEHCS